MKVFQNLQELSQELGKTEINVTIGNFDGVHLGHQDFLLYIKKESENLNRKFLVVTFIPHPSFVLRGNSGFLINSYIDRRKLLEKVGVDFLLELDFTRDFSSLSPIDFLNKYLFSLGGIKKIFLGHDFHFGANKSGDYTLAKKEAEKVGLELIIYSEFKIQNNSVSSTVIRNNIKDGKFVNVTKMLGRNYFLSGRVIKGMGRGKKIGFPTANLGYDKDVILPSKGVYITRTTVNNMTYNSVTNVGVNPTFNTGYELHVETHLLGFTQDIYGEEINVQFVDKVRDEKKFNSVNELVDQISQDVESVKKYYEKI